VPDLELVCCRLDKRRHKGRTPSGNPNRHFSSDSLLDAENGEERGKIGTPPGDTRLAFSPAGGRLAAVTNG